MQDEETATGEPGANRKPAYRLSLVIDREGAEPEWVEIVGLWPTKKKTGFTGKVESLQVIPAGARLVLTAATDTKAPSGGKAS